MIKIALNPNGEAEFDTVVPIEGTNYTLHFRWNVRPQDWFITVYDETGQNVIIGSQRCVIWYPIAAEIPDRQPPGAFVFFDTSGAGLNPGFGDLGARVPLYYLTASDLGI